MAEVKWIKITTDIFDDDKLLLIESMPDADSIIVCWFKLLVLAGKQNNAGVFLMNERIPYTDEMLATIFRRPLNTVRLALSTFRNYGMIDIIDNVITIPKWDKHQSLDAYEKKLVRDKQYQQEKRAKQKLIAEKSSDNRPTNRLTSDDTFDNRPTNRLTSDDTFDDSSSDVAVSDKIRLEEDKIRLDKTIDTIPTTSTTVVQDAKPEEKPSLTKNDVNFIVGAWNEIPELTKILGLDSKSKPGRLLLELSETYSPFRIVEGINKVKASDFLRGVNESGWKISFEWFLDKNNFEKVLSGQYDNRQQKKSKAHEYPPDKFDPTAIDRIKITKEE